VKAEELMGAGAADFAIIYVGNNIRSGFVMRKEKGCDDQNDICVVAYRGIFLVGA